VEDIGLSAEHVESQMSHPVNDAPLFRGDVTEYRGDMFKLYASISHADIALQHK
jgi:hypothetical protein